MKLKNEHYYNTLFNYSLCQSLLIITKAFYRTEHMQISTLFSKPKLMPLSDQMYLACNIRY